MKKPQFNTSAIVILGYCILVTLAITGFIRIYSEVVKSHKQSINNTVVRQELIDLNNTLTTMYQAEGTASLLAFAENKQLKSEYDSLTYRVLDQIDSLKLISSDQIINLHLDSLAALLTKKRDNAVEMFELIKQIDKDIIEEVTNKTIIAKNDVSKLNDIVANIIKEKEDTVKLASEKRSFLQRVGDVFNPNARDTITQISKSSVSEITELTAPILVDTIIDYITHIVDKQKQNKNAEIIQKLITRQHRMYIIKELTTFQINKIMDMLKDREYQTNFDILTEKNNSLKNSSKLVAFVGLSALIVAVFFMSWTLHSLNKARRLQKSIQEAKKHAEKLLMSREQLIYTITHDIKAPLSSIIGFLDLMSEEMSSQKQQYYIGNIQSSISHIMDLVRNLLDFHSIEKEQPQLTTIAFLPAAIIHNIYESFLPLAQKKKLRFELNSTIPESKPFLSDPYYIRQIINNLVSNAIKYTPEQGEIILITSIDEQNHWKISVKDNGPGISPENQLRVFDEFIRLGKQKNKIDGTGLGLTISKKLTNLLDGTIELESQEGVGSVFILTIPLTPISEEALLLQDDIYDDASGRILFVDDDKVQLKLLYEIMKKEDLSCVCCSSAYEALSVLKKKQFDIIITDIYIQDMNGLDLIKLIRESGFHQTATVPIIASSAGYNKPKAEFIAAGFDGFLPKPFNARQLLEIIEKFTSFKRKTNEPYTENDKPGWNNIMAFVAGDHESAMKIIDSLIEETNKNRELLKNAFKKNDNEAIKQISHKMLTLMRMISAHDIISILIDFENGDITKEKKETLLRLLEETIKEAENALKGTTPKSPKGDYVAV